MLASPCSSALYIAMDLGRDSWQLAISDGGKTIREVKVVRKDVEAGKAEFLTEVAKARVKFGLDDEAPVHALYEAGRDGFWIARWLESVGIPCLGLVDRTVSNPAINATAFPSTPPTWSGARRHGSRVAIPGTSTSSAAAASRIHRRTPSGSGVCTDAAPRGRYLHACIRSPDVLLTVLDFWKVVPPTYGSSTVNS